MAGKLYLGTHQDDPNAPGNYSKFQIPSSYVISKPPQDVSATKNLKCCLNFQIPAKGMAGKVRLETHQDDPMLNVLQ
jgi:hypothetical protein